MKRKTKIQDERVISESNRIYKLCFYILCIGIFLDLIIKFNLYSFNELDSENFPSFLLEGVLLVVIFYLNLILLAKKGIAFGVSEIELDFFPKKRYATISSVISLILSIGLWTLRFSVGAWEYGIFSAILFCGAIYLLTFLVAFIVLFISFYIIYKIAKKHTA